MRALTIWPEWCWAILHLGKDVENRTWLPPINAGEELALHAGRNVGGTGRLVDATRSLAGVAAMAERAGWAASARIVAGDARDDVEIRFTRPDPMGLDMERRLLKMSDLSCGAVVASSVLGSYMDPRAATSPWAAPEQMPWPLEQVQPLAAPVACRGYQRVWYLPPDVEEAVREQLEVFDG